MWDVAPQLEAKASSREGKGKQQKLGLAEASEEISWSVVETLQRHVCDSKIKLWYLIRQSDAYFRDKEKNRQPEEISTETCDALKIAY